MLEQLFRRINNEIMVGNLDNSGLYKSDEKEQRNINTPLRSDAFNLDEEEKMKKIEASFKDIMDVLGLDLKDDSLQDTPKRVAKMFVKEIFSGLNPANKPSVSVFANTYGYKDMLIEKDILVQSSCEHHFLPFFGKAHVAYIPNDNVIGLSKINRIVDYYCRRPQVQERLTLQIAQELKQVLGTEDVAVYIESKHMCVAMRGIKDDNSSTVTFNYSGKFAEREYKDQFMQMISK